MTAVCKILVTVMNCIYFLTAVAALPKGGRLWSIFVWVFNARYGYRGLTGTPGDVGLRSGCAPQGSNMGSVCSEQKVLVWGGGSKAKILIHWMRHFFLDKNITIYDPYKENLDFYFHGDHVTDLRDICDNIDRYLYFVVCFGEDNYSRCIISDALATLGIVPLNFISDSAIISEEVELGRGIQVMTRVTVNLFSSIGDYSVLNTGCNVDHDCVVGRGVHIMGGASVAGRVQIGDFATIGTNATILPGISIGRGAYVGAGAVVTRDVDDFYVVTGVPARYMRMNSLSVNQDELDLLTSHARGTPGDYSRQHHNRAPSFSISVPDIKRQISYSGAAVK